MSDKDKDATNKAAILMLALGEAEAAEVMKFLGPREVLKLGAAMAQMKAVQHGQVVKVLEDFVEETNLHSTVGLDSDEYIRQVLTKALGDDKAAVLLNRILGGKDASGIESLKWMDSVSVAELIRNEHPQIIATILVHLERDQACEILNFMSGEQESAVMDNIKNYDNDMAQKIMDEMFVFDNIIDIDDRGIQLLLREVQSEMLIIALKGASQDLREKIFKNMSQRASEMMREDLESKGPVRLSEVESQQKQILQIVRRLSDEGQIVLGGKGEDSFV